MRKQVFGLLIGLAISGLSVAVTVTMSAQTPPRGPNGLPPWAYHIPDKEQPKEAASEGPVHIPGSSKAYTVAQIEDHANPPDWFPDEHTPMPGIVKGGVGPEVNACGSCHLMSGRGHPESADLSGLPAEYIMRQMAYFKSGARKDPARMNAIAKATSDEDIRQAALWFSSLTPKPWIRVVEGDTVPKSYVSRRERRRQPWPEGGTETLGNRIIALPEDGERALSQDPRSGFVAYVPPGSIAKGEALVKTGNAGKTLQCALCHGESLRGLGEVPRIAGLHPVYIFRQLFDLKNGTSAGKASELMKRVVANLSEDDMIAVSAYVGSLAP